MDPATGTVTGMTSSQPATGDAAESLDPAVVRAGSARPAWPVWAAVPVGGAVVAAGSFAGWWWLPFAVGLVLGVAGRLLGTRRGLALLVPALAAVVGWGFPLLRLAAHGDPVGGTAHTVAALAGLPDTAALPIAVTLLLAVVQALLGTWLGRALTPDRRAAG
jgi:hypothetical protein